MARKRGKNPYLWGVLSGIFPFFLLVLKVQYKQTDKTTTPPSEKQ